MTIDVWCDLEMRTFNLPLIQQTLHCQNVMDFCKSKTHILSKVFDTAWPELFSETFFFSDTDRSNHQKWVIEIHSFHKLFPTFFNKFSQRPCIENYEEKTDNVTLMASIFKETKKIFSMLAAAEFCCNVLQFLCCGFFHLSLSKVPL